MGRDQSDRERPSQTGSKPYQIRIPRFISDSSDEVGLGDVLKRATYAIGIKPCGGCARRAAALNQRVVFSGRARRA